MNKEMKVIIASYPRSGQSYLQSSLTLAFSKSFDFSHLNKSEEIKNLSNYDKVLTIVRNPIESISSIVAMELYFNPDFNLLKRVEKRTQDYIDFYSIICDKADIFIDFNQINTNLKQILNYVSSETGFQILNNNPPNLVKDLPNQQFLKSSQSSDNYKDAKKALEEINISKCNELYQVALKRCVNLNEI